jgi:hypothetical protein
MTDEQMKASLADKVRKQKKPASDEYMQVGSDI